MKHLSLWVLVLAIGILLSLCVGRYGLTLQETIETLCFQGDDVWIRLIYRIRLPRILLAVVSGGALSICGLIFQNVFRNGLASPDLLATTSGCSFGAIVGILTFNEIVWIEGTSFLFGLVSLAIVFFLARNQKGNAIVNLLVCGIIVQAIFNSLILACKIVADPYQELPSIEYWLMGSFSDASWSTIQFSFLIIVVSSIVLYRMRWHIQNLAFQEEAASLGIEVKKVRTITLVLCTLLVSSVISVAGPVSWVGLLVPHMIRLWLKKDMAQSFGRTFILGSIFVLACDTLARCLFAIELPISVVTSFFGAIYLIVLFRKGKRIV